MGSELDIGPAGPAENIDDVRLDTECEGAVVQARQGQLVSVAGGSRRRDVQGSGVER